MTEFSDLDQGPDLPATAAGTGARAVARLLAVAVLVAGLAVLSGYAAHVQALVRPSPHRQGMSPLTAVGLIVLALAALSLSRADVSRAMFAVAVVLGLGMTLAHLAAGADLISPWISTRVFGFSADLAGRMSLATGSCIALLGAAGFARRRPWLADALAAIPLLTASLALLGYAYGVRDLYALSVFDTMALHTALSVFGLSIASILLQPQGGWAEVIASQSPGGRASRRQLMFVAAPPLLGWMLLGATHAQTLGPSAAVAFLVALTVAPLALLVLRDGALLNALERERQRRADELAASANELREQLTRQAAELARESAERAKAEEAAYRAQRLEAVGQLTGGIAHDFNNLLMGIGGNLQLLERRLDESHPARRYLENAQLAADRGAKVTAQLLAFSRTQKLNVRPIEVDPVLRRSRDLVGNALGPNIDFNLSLHALGDWAMSDGDQLELAILNLALNARDAMPDGGSLTLESRPCRRPLVAGSQEADYLLVELSDTGVGMSPEIVAQAVEPFFTTKERGKGTGLGLAQVYGFLRQCGGDLEIDSQPGKGTVVSLLFPRTVAGAETESLRPQPLNQKAAAGGNGRRLVVIDDDDSVRAVIVDALRAAGFEVSEADNGADGLRLLEQDDPVAAIIDFIMPGLNGAEVGRRAQIRRPGLPIIFVSGYFDTLALDSISGATVLRKPFDVDGLTNAVKDALHA